jgi:hypothetical protein
LINKLASLLPKPLKSLAVRFDTRPIETVEALTEFAQTRASYVSQTALFGYLKARMGTRFPVYFEDEEFSASIRAAAARVYASGLSDLTVFCVATAGAESRLDRDQASGLARACYSTGLKRALTEIESGQLEADAVRDFDNRLAETVWDSAAQAGNAFSGSEADLVRYAPVVEEFKQLDREIVSNSIRFRWRDVREQFRKRVDPEALCRAWLDADRS